MVDFFHKLAFWGLFSKGKGGGGSAVSISLACFKIAGNKN